MAVMATALPVQTRTAACPDQNRCRAEKDNERRETQHRQLLTRSTEASLSTGCLAESSNPMHRAVRLLIAER